MITPHQEEHLTDEQFAGLLAGAQPGAGAASHLEHCELCRNELEAVGVAVGDLSVASAQWAERVAPARVSTLTRWERALGGRIPWAAGLAMTSAAGVLAFCLGHYQGTHVAPPSPAAVAVAPSSSALADDNRLLLSISQELNYRAETPALALNAPGNEHGRRASRADAVVN